MKRRLEDGCEPPLWRAMGAVLPRSIREGVYEPAYLDLWRSVAAGRPRPTNREQALTWLRVAGYLMASVFYSIPRYLSGWGCTPAARWATRITLAVVAFFALAVLLLPWIMVQLGYTY